MFFERSNYTISTITLKVSSNKQNEFSHEYVVLDVAIDFLFYGHLLPCSWKRVAIDSDFVIILTRTGTTTRPPPPTTMTTRLNFSQVLHLKCTQGTFQICFLPSMECANEMLFLENLLMIVHGEFFLQIAYSV